MPTANATARRLARYIPRFAGKRIAVVGDFMLDEFLWGRVSRISPEAPVPVVDVTSHTMAPGGAGNVAANIAALGGEAVPFGVIGDDAAGDKLLESLPVSGRAGMIMRADDRHTTVKTRIIEVSRKHQIVRADRESREPAPAALLAQLARSVIRTKRIDAVVISDYDKGTITPALLEELLPALEERRIPVFVDPRTRHPRSYRPITAITPNEREAREIAEAEGIVSIESVGTRILEMLDCPYVLITLGERGLALFERGKKVRTIGTLAQEVYDVTGAGDTVIAALALAFSAGASMIEAASLANCAAGRAVAHIGTVAPTADEVRAALFDAARRSPDHSGWKI